MGLRVERQTDHKSFARLTEEFGSYIEGCGESLGNFKENQFRNTTLSWQSQATRLKVKPFTLGSYRSLGTKQRQRDPRIK